MLKVESPISRHAVGRLLLTLYALGCSPQGGFEPASLWGGVVLLACAASMCKDPVPECIQVQCVYGTVSSFWHHQSELCDRRRSFPFHFLFSRYARRTDISSTPAFASEANSLSPQFFPEASVPAWSSGSAAEQAWMPEDLEVSQWFLPRFFSGHLGGSPSAEDVLTGVRIRATLW